MGIKKIGYILGRRIRGDMEMDLDPETGLFGAIIGPGARIAERPSQSYDEASNTQNYRIGSRMMLDDRVFRYAMAGDTLCPGYGAKNTIPQHVGFAAIGGCTEGEYTVVVTVGGTDGILGDGVIGEDELEGGYLVIFTPGNNAINRRDRARRDHGQPLPERSDWPQPCRIGYGDANTNCNRQPVHLDPDLGAGLDSASGRCQCWRPQ